MRPERDANRTSRPDSHPFAIDEMLLRWKRQRCNDGSGIAAKFLFFDNVREMAALKNWQ
jgi:hypothetical protein